MSQSDRSEPSKPAGSLSAERLLPPVEPPSAGFIVQLFVIPGLIVLVIVLVWLMFSWVARSSTDAKSFIIELKRNNEARWQAALNLASALHSDRKLRGDQSFARELAALLERETASGETDDAALMFRVYLCRALGEFDVATPMDALLKAANPGGSGPPAVRCAAIQAIATLTDRLRRKGPAPAGPADPAQANSNGGNSVSPGVEPMDPWSDRAEVAEALLKLADDADNAVRSNAAFALGVIAAAPPVLEKLRFLANDSYADARFNAATALARTGDAAAIPTLLEMIDPESDAGAALEAQAEFKASKRATIHLNALRSIERLAATNPAADRAALASAVERLAETKSLDESVRTVAQQVLLRLNESRPE